MAVGLVGREIFNRHGMRNGLDMSLKKLTSPSLIVFDFDGVFTDNTVYIDEDGKESVRCSKADSLGIAMLREQGVSMCILSTETNPVVSIRGKKLSIPVFQGCGNKAAFLSAYLNEHDISFERVVYMGNDVNDLDAMSLVGVTVCPADAHPAIKAIASIVLSSNGGKGAVRELCDMLLSCGKL